MSRWRELKYRFADRFFEYELDEAFRHGQVAGRQYLASRIRVEMEYKKTRLKNLNLTKTQEIGYEKAMEVVQDIIK
jgi:hypothetical protein